MRVYPEQFGDHLKAGLRPCYLIFGDEPLLRLEAIDAIRQLARKEGFDERHTFTVEQGLDWNQVHDACKAMSLFSARQIIELELPAKVDKDLAARISEIGKQIHPDLLLVLSGGRLNQTQMKTAWFDRLYQIGTYVPVNHPEPRFFPRWMSARFARFGLKALPDAINFMCHSYEGNLLAASQEIEKLTLLSPPQPISVTYLQETIIRHAHFTPFQLVDTLLEGKVNRAQRILAALQAEGTEPGMLAWTLCRELEQLTELSLAMRNGQPLGEHFSRLRIWQSRQQLIQQALTRLPFAKLQQLWQLMARLDDALRRFDNGQAWLMLQTVALGFRDSSPLPDVMLEHAPC
ncbi:MAG: DNA polymerase III subunit delta [Aeromonas sp.]